MGRPPMKQAYTVCYEKGGTELQRYTITALTQGAAETEARRGALISKGLK